MAEAAGSGDWLLAEELFERGDPSFVDAIRRIDDADRLGSFASRWVADTRAEARRLLFEYLDRPLNAYRHEALVKRMFKAAEIKGDDALLARYLVAFDRTIRRVEAKRSRYQVVTVSSKQKADALVNRWREQGMGSTSVWQDQSKRYQVSGFWYEPTASVPSGTTMPRGKPRHAYDPRSWDQRSRNYTSFTVPDWVYVLKLNPVDFRNGGGIPESKRKEIGRRRLYSVATRNYLRRRAWRYFRRLGRTHPERYVPAVRGALALYRDEDAADGLALIDNWSLIHILFRYSPCLTYDDRAWIVAEGHSLAELEPAPAYPKLWDQSPRTLVELLIGARSRPVRGWAIRMIRKDVAAVLPVFSFDERLGLLAHEDPDVVNLASDLIRDDPALKDVPVDRWLELAEGANASSLALLCELMGRLISPDRVSLDQALRLAMQRPLPLARLGLQWLGTMKVDGEESCRKLLILGEAECDAVRPELVAWAGGVLSKSEHFRPEWAMEWLDSRHRDVREVSWEWFRRVPSVRDDLTTLQRLMESPYDDIRLALVADFQARAGNLWEVQVERGDLDPELLRLMWASVLLNVHRGGRGKPMVVRQLVRRIERRPGELSRLLPLLAVALRSVRGPEWRAGLSAVVRLAERDGAAAELVRATFPELQLV